MRVGKRPNLPSDTTYLCIPEPVPMHIHIPNTPEKEVLEWVLPSCGEPRCIVGRSRRYLLGLYSVGGSRNTCCRQEEQLQKAKAAAPAS